TSGTLEIYRSLGAEPVAALPLEDCLVQQTGAWSMQITSGYRDAEQDHRVAFYLRASSTNLKDEWADLIATAQSGAAVAAPASSVPEEEEAEAAAGSLLYRLDNGREAPLPELLARFAKLT